jgi:hypothetical protein
VLAYCTLDYVLGQFILEGIFTCTKKNNNCFMLSDKMKSAKSAISWVDYNLVDRGREVRNDLAHKSKVASKVDCIKYIDAVEAELRSWKLIS